MTQPLKLAIPECGLADDAVGPQLARCRQLAQHTLAIHRETGQVRVRFDQTAPDGLIALTLAVERECCPFVGLDYQPQTRTLTITVADVAHDARLDTLQALLTPPDGAAAPG